MPSEIERLADEAKAMRPMFSGFSANMTEAAFYAGEMTLAAEITMRFAGRKEESLPGEVYDLLKWLRDDRMVASKEALDEIMRKLP